MTRPKNPKAMHGWLGHRHNPYDNNEISYILTREIIALNFPKKEFFETIWMANTIAPYIDFSFPILDACCGHGFLGMLLSTYKESKKVFLVDKSIPPNLLRLAICFQSYFSDFNEKVSFYEMELNEKSEFSFEPKTIISSHACGFASDNIIKISSKFRANFFIMPCCISNKVARHYGFNSVNGNELNILNARVNFALSKGYQVQLLHIPEEITPYNIIIAGTLSEIPNFLLKNEVELILSRKLPKSSKTLSDYKI